jgi:transposase
MQSILDLGADVDSRYVMIACAADSFKPHRIANEAKGIRAWLRSVPRGSRLAMESTGRYHQVLAELAHKAGLQVFVVNARDLRRYAQAIGRRGKTDRVDAEVIARYVAREHGELHAYVPQSNAQKLLTQLIVRRAMLIQTKDSIRQSLSDVSELKTETRQLLDHIDRVIGCIERQVKRTLEQMPTAHEAAERIAQIPGFGVLTSTWLGHRFTRVPYSTSDAVVAAAGLDPRPDDSGQKQGQRKLSKRGPAEERRLLFNCARSAAQTRLWRPYYEAQRAKGLSSTAATIVLARKMLRVAFAVHRHRQPFDPLLIGRGA